MTYERFTELCEQPGLHSDSSQLPKEPLLMALWHARRGHWNRAHDIAVAERTPAGSALHAHLHRQEGDLSNAQYWYSRAGRRPPDVTVEMEWESLAREFCENT